MRLYFKKLIELPHTQGTQGISGSFQVEENLRETQENSGNLDLFIKLREVLIFFNSGKF